MTIKETLAKYRKSIHPDETELLLSHLLSMTKEQLYMNYTQAVPVNLLKRLDGLIKKRKLGWPIAYLVGFKNFYGLKFLVNQNVLIPRPESEWLVERTLELVKQKVKNKKSIHILEVGTGSGCIAISIAKTLKSKNVWITATDISSRALKVAKENAKIQKVKVSFSKHNLFNGISKKYDLIIANLPYVPLNDYRKLYKNLKYEPKLALVDKAKDFELLGKFLGQAQTYIKPGGIILIESDPLYFKTNRNIFSKIYKDIHQLDRFGEIHY